MPGQAHHAFSVKQRAYVAILLVLGAVIAFLAVRTWSPASALSQPAPAANATPTARSAR